MKRQDLRKWVVREWHEKKKNDGDEDICYFDVSPWLLLC